MDTTDSREGNTKVTCFNSILFCAKDGGTKPERALRSHPVNTSDVRPFRSLFTDTDALRSITGWAACWRVAGGRGGESAQYDLSVYRASGLFLVEV